MKILLVNTLYSPNLVGGAEKSVQQLAEGLAACGHRPAVISTAKEDRIGEVNGIKAYYLNYRNLYWGIESKEQSFLKKILWHSKDVYNWSMKRVLQEIIEEEQPDVVHTNNLSGFSIVPWIAAKERGIPVVHTLRDYYLMCPQSAMFRDGQNCVKRCASCRVLSESKRALSNGGYVDHVVGISQFILDFHRQHGYFRRVTGSKIFNGIPAYDVRARQMKNEGDKLAFLYMGRIDESKGVHRLIEVFSEIQGVELWLGGKVTDPAMKRRLEEGTCPDHIRCLGYIDPQEVLPKADALILPSLWHEPFGRVIFEAYACGVPVIGTNRGGIPEIIEQGRTGYIYDPDEEGGLKRLIERLRDEPEMLRALSIDPKRFISRHSVERTVQQYIGIYQRMIRPMIDPRTDLEEVN